MKIKPIMVPNTGIDWGRKKETATQSVALDVNEGNLYQTEVARLEAKYHRALSKKEVCHELGNISLKTLERRMEKAVDLPEYKELRTGRIIFPISAVATYLSQGLVRTV